MAHPHPTSSAILYYASENPTWTGTQLIVPMRARNQMLPRQQYGEGYQGWRLRVLVPAVQGWLAVQRSRRRFFRQMNMCAGVHGASTGKVS